MMIHRRLIAKGIKYYLTLPHNTGHGIHSPFLFRLINKVFVKDIDNTVLHKIENYRQSLAGNHRKINIIDLGAKGSGRCVQKKIRDIALKESTPEHYGKLLYNLVAEYKPGVIIELGTSLGIGTLYMALANPGGMVRTIEGSPEKATLAASVLNNLTPNVEVITGAFDEQLHKILEENGKADFVFIDGNHKKYSTLHYFEEVLKYSHSDTVIILDDINWSPEMMQAWNEIQHHQKTRVCLDLFRMGIVLLNPKLQKENFTIFY